MLTLRLTALVLVIDVVPVWYLRPPLLILAGLGLVFPAALRTPGLWGGITLLTLVRIVRLWPWVDNHHYLLFYWTLGIFIALCLPRPERALAISARWLVAFVFLWAAVWKGILSPDFMDGRFYRLRLLTDDRFAEATMLLGGLSEEELLRNRAYLTTPGSPAEISERPAGLVEPPAFSALVTVLTWSTLLIEAAVALAFLLPWGRWRQLRHALLIMFCVTAYLLAPVPAFGWLLATLGIAQVPATQPRLRGCYVAVFFLILVFRYIPWHRLT